MTNSLRNNGVNRRQDCHARGGPRPPILVLGIGNVLRSDDGVGVRVVEAMQGLDLPDDVEVCDGGTAGLALLEVIADRAMVVVVDALDGDGEPGTVVRLKPDDLLSDGAGRISQHELGLLQVLAAARHLGCAPDDVVVFGVQRKSVGWGTELSAEVARRVPEVVALILAEIAACSGLCGTALPRAL